MSNPGVGLCYSSSRIPPTSLTLTDFTSTPSPLPSKSNSGVGLRMSDMRVGIPVGEGRFSPGPKYDLTLRPGSQQAARLHMCSVYSTTPSHLRVSRFNRLSEALVGVPKSQAPDAFYVLPDTWNKKSFNRKFNRPKTTGGGRRVLKKNYTAIKAESRRRKVSCALPEPKNLSPLPRSSPPLPKGPFSICKGTSASLTVDMRDIGRLAESLRQEVKRAKREAGFHDENSSSPETSIAGGTRGGGGTV